MFLKHPTINLAQHNQKELEFFSDPAVIKPGNTCIQCRSHPIKLLIHRDVT